MSEHGSRFAAGSLPQWSIADDAAAVATDTRALTAQSPEQRYERGEVLGVGGMGRVVLAHDRHLDRTVALKEIHVGHDDRATLRARLLREALTTARLDHPGIVPVYDVGELADGTLFYTMRVVRGQSLAIALEHARVGARERLLRSLLAACEAVGFAHRMGVVHRDLKPGNVMIGEFGETQVVDWGLAREVGDGRNDGDAVGRAVGTPGYMSPEQARGERAAHAPTTDVYSLGVILREIIALEPATPELTAIANRATASSPADRYPDAKALADDLASYLDGRKVAAHDYSAWQLLARFGRVWRVPLAVAAVALIALALAIGLGYAETERERVRAVAAEGLANDSARAATDALATAQDNLGALLLDQARSQHLAGARPEAELLAARARTFVDSPEARAILLANDATTRPAILAAHALPGDCVEPVAAPEGEAVACHDAQTISLWDLAPLHLRWRTALSSVRAPVFLADGTVIANTQEAIIVLDGATGAVRATHQRPAITLSAQGDGHALAAVWSPLTLSLVGATGDLASIEICQAALPIVATSRAGFAAGTAEWLALCGDGTLFGGLADLGTGAIPTPSHGLATGLEGAASLAMLPGTRVLVALHDGHIVLVDHGRGVSERIFELASGLQPIRELRVSPDARIAAIRGERSGIALLDLATGSWLGRMPAAMNLGMRFVGDRELVTLGDGWRRWRLPAPEPLLIQTGGGVTSIAFRDEGRPPNIRESDGAIATESAREGAKENDRKSATTFAIASEANVERWRLFADGAERMRAERWQTLTVKSLAFARDGTLDAVSSGALGVHRIDFDNDRARDLGALRARRVGRLDGPAATSWLVQLSYDRFVAAREDAPEGATQIVVGPDGVLGDHNDLAMAPGHRFAAVLSNGEARVRRLVVQRDIVVVDRELEVGDAIAVALERAGDRAWTAHDRELRQWDLDSGALLTVIATPNARLLEVAVSDVDRAGRTWLAAGDRSGGTWLWSLDAQATLVAHFDDHTERVVALAFSPDVSRLLSGSWDGTVRVRSLAAPPGLADLERAWAPRDAPFARPTPPPLR